MSSALLQLEALALAGATTGVSEPCEVLREIEEGDLALLRSELKEHNWAKARGAQGVGSLTALRMGHQQLAQALAAGIAPEEAAWMTGRSVASVKGLLSDPAFQELLEYYRENQRERDFNAFERLVTLGGTAMSVLQERLEESPERFSNKDLKDLMEASMDRSVAPARGGTQRGGASGSQAVSVNIRFVEAPAPRQELREVSPKEITIEATPEED